MVIYLLLMPVRQGVRSILCMSTGDIGQRHNLTAQDNEICGGASGVIRISLRRIRRALLGFGEERGAYA